jgi:hypothetical protein
MSSKVVKARSSKGKGPGKVSLAKHGNNLWTTTQDEDLLRYVQGGEYIKKSGKVDWEPIAGLFSFNTRQVRDHWNNLLDPSIR